MVELTATQPMQHRHRKRHSAAYRRRRFLHSLEAVSAIILALGGVTSAWCGYEASLLDGEQAAAYAQAGALRTSSSRSATTAGQLADIDVLTFLNWASANTAGQADFKTFVEHRFRPEFKPVFDAWLATDPMSNPTAPATPFEMPQYKPRFAEDAARLTAEADRIQKLGDEANDHGDQFSRATIVFALSLFFIAVAQQFRGVAVRTAVVLTAGGLMVFGLWAVAQLPRAMPG